MANAYAKQIECGMWDGSEVVYFNRTIVDQKAARHGIELLVEAAQAVKPDAGISFGYVGNLERGRDDRAWYVWTRIPVENPSPTRQYKCVHIGKDFAGSFERVKAFLQAVCAA